MNASLLGVLPKVESNATTAAQDAATATNTHVGSDNSLENLLPLLGLRGVAPLSNFIGDRLGVDPTNLLTIFGLVWAFNHLFRWLYDVLDFLIFKHLMSSIYVDSADEIYQHLMKWFSSQPHILNSRFLYAMTVRRPTLENEDESTVSSDKSGEYLNFSDQEARSVSSFFPVRYCYCFCLFV